MPSDCKPSLIYLPEEQSQSMAELLPASTLAFLRDTGVPDVVVFRGVDHAFTLDMEPLLDGKAFRVGSCDQGWGEMALEQGTGRFGYVHSAPEHRGWVCGNSSVEQFLACFAASERLWKLEESRQIAWESRGDFLEGEIRRIDPAVLADPNNIWSVLVEELRAGVV